MSVRACIAIRSCMLVFDNGSYLEVGRRGVCGRKETKVGGELGRYKARKKRTRLNPGLLALIHSELL